MLRIHFTPADLARTQVALQPDPMWETVLSLHVLHSRVGRLVFEPWRRQARLAASRRARELLGALAPPVGNFPDSLTPIAGGLGLDAGLDALLSTPRRQLRMDVERLGRRLPAHLDGLANGDVAVLRSLAASIRTYHDAVLLPFWSELETPIRLDRTIRQHTMQQYGVSAMLDGLPPPLRWEPPTLLTDYPNRRRQHKDLYLGGRGLLLIPSYFCWGRPVTLMEPDLPPVLVYPVEHRRFPTEPRTTPDGLATLLGRTRAAVLAALTTGCTTTELAHRVGISLSSASEHSTALRKAGLASHTRQGNAVIHSLTPLGLALLRGDRP